MINTLIRRLIAFAKRLPELFKPWFTVKRAVILIGLAGLVIVTFITGLFLLVRTGALGPVATEDELSKIENPVASEIYSSDSVLLGRYYIQERSDIRYQQIPQHLIDALLSTEDVRFYDHNGIDYRSLGRVLVKSILLQADASGGGSTLTQQLAKNLYPRKSYWMFSLLINKMSRGV